MEENSECKDCKTWEKEMYWTHFSSFHFFLTLPPNFHDHLVLPEKFASHMKVQLPDKVSLKAPSGAMWKVDVLKSDDILFVGNEWKDFVEANHVKENSLLMFKYDRNSSFEVLMFDQESSCEREDSYFLKKCGHSMSDHDDQNTKIAREASSTELIEDVNEEDLVFKSKKFRIDDGQEGCSGSKANTQSPFKNVLHAAAKCRDRPGRLIQPHKSLAKAKVKTKKRSIRNETGKKRRQISPGDVITPEKNDYPHKLQAHSKKSLNKSSVATGLNHNTVEVIISDSSENSHMLKGQSENQPARDNTAKEPSPISKRDLLVLINSDFEDIIQTIDHSYKSKDQSKTIPRMNENSNDLSQNVGKELITHENCENTPTTYCSHKVKSQVDKKQKASGTVKEVTPISWRSPDDRESFPEEDHSQKFNGKSGLQKKKGSNSLKMLVLKNVSSQKKCSSKRTSSGSERTSSRRPVTEEEKEGALQRASQKETENSFTVIMRPTSVYRRFFLNIPAKWPLKHLLDRNEDVILRVGKETWITTFSAYGSGRGLYKGWKTFVIDNNLEEFDVLVFTQVSSKVGAPKVLDVEIFRVV